MIVVDRCLVSLLSEYSTGIKALHGMRPIPPELDLTAFAVLYLAVRYGAKLGWREEIVGLIKECEAGINGEGEVGSDPSHVSNIPLEWKSADCLPFLLARKLIASKGRRKVGPRAPYRLLTHRDSEVRGHCYKVFWLCRENITKKIVLNALFKNLADTMGYVEHAAGLARALFPSDEQFFEAAYSYKPKRFVAQYFDRLGQLKVPGIMQSYVELFHSLENEVRDKIQQAAQGAESPLKYPRFVQLKLPFPELMRRELAQQLRGPEFA